MPTLTSEQRAQAWVTRKANRARREAEEAMSMDDLDISESGSGRTKAPKAAPTAKPKAITKSALKGMLEVANGGFALAGYGRLALLPEEIESLADSWYEVIKLYPAFGQVLTKGNVLSVWGNALVVTLIVLERRRAAFAETPAGTTRNPDGDDGQRQDDPGPTLIRRA